MKRFTFILFIMSLVLNAAPGIDPIHPDLNSARLNALKRGCSNPAIQGVKNCEKATLFELHMKENIHKGVSFGAFSPYAGSWVNALVTAEQETKLFDTISSSTDIGMMNVIQSQTMMFSGNSAVSDKLAKFAGSVASYHFFMDTVMKQTLAEFKIEALIFQALSERNLGEKVAKFKKK